LVIPVSSVALKDMVILSPVYTFTGISLVISILGGSSANVTVMLVCVGDVVGVVWELEVAVGLTIVLDVVAGKVVVSVGVWVMAWLQDGKVRNKTARSKQSKICFTMNIVPEVKRKHQIKQMIQQ
jgi:hypothetical protein